MKTDYDEIAQKIDDALAVFTGNSHEPHKRSGATGSRKMANPVSAFLFIKNIEVLL